MSEETIVAPLPWGREVIEGILPHRDPFVWVSRIVAIEPGASIEGELDVPADLDIFRGHFPDHPVLPGVCTLQLVRECLNRGTGRRFRYAAIRECKFLGMIVPQADTLLDIDIRLADDGTAAKKVTCVVTNNEKTVLKLKATATPEP